MTKHRTGGGFGGSFLAEQLLRRKRPQIGHMANYLNEAHYQRVVDSWRKKTRLAVAAGKHPPPPPSPPRVWESGL